ncbi:hypothetical protein QJS10_CPB04g01706 [Acorus calamus]|uniref:RNase H type-1 domain-containing protein n=1 Tax=Acorus calamus TaxID=4465 RepID=A0AAV9F3V3_ACOCL|nr:hypothetical protein QJS10_CPB04g01706 [Acorus calamus]
MANHWGPTESTSVSKLILNGAWTTTNRWPSTYLSVWEDITKIRVGGNHDDVPIWTESKTGALNSKAAWNYLRTPKPLSSWKGWAWDPDQLPRHSYTTWLALLNKLPTLLRLQNRGIIHTSTCSLCYRVAEDEDHLFFRCGYSSYIWRSLLAKMGLPRTASGTLIGWVESLNQLHLQPALIKVLKVLFATTIGLISKERCSRIFRSQSRHKISILQDIIDTAVLRLSKQTIFAEPCQEVEKTERNLGIHFLQKKYHNISFIWDPPPQSGVKCNSDGSLSDDRAGFGALIRDPKGNFIIGETARVPAASINNLELLGVKCGALLCLNLNLRKVQFATDSTTVTCWLQGRGAVPWTSKRDLIETFNILNHLDEWTISHTYREANASADLLAARQSSMGSTIIHIQDIWSELEDAILKDKQGTIYKRKISDQLNAQELH